jgi:hypothetical protein
MICGIFAKVRLRNRLAPGAEGGEKDSCTILKMLWKTGTVRVVDIVDAVTGT